MSSDAISARNRANAQKSTGPRSVRGMAIVSANARSHGATSKPDPTSVAAWLRIILDATDLEPDDILRHDGRSIAALALAEAEVRLCSARAALVAFERGDAALTKGVKGRKSSAEGIIEELREEITTVEVLRSCLSILRCIEKVVVSVTGYGERRHRLLQRYVREARGHRKRAFQTWLKCLCQTGALSEEFV